MTPLGVVALIASLVLCYLFIKMADNAKKERRRKDFYSSPKAYKGKQKTFEEFIEDGHDINSYM